MIDSQGGKPFLKWAGGKRQLLPVLREKIKNIPYQRYIEPFIGGGALFFDLKPKNAIINDINEELVNVYKTVKDNHLELIEHLKQHINTQEYFMKIRSLDRDRNTYKSLSDLERASRFIFLNRTAFNGLYRVNKKGEFNTSYGKYKNPNIVQEESIKQASKILQNTKIFNKSIFELNCFKEGDLVYLDPPYIPLSKTASFKEYSKEGFPLDDQKRLANLCKDLNSKGINFILSNSYTEDTLGIYSGFLVQEVLAKRNIASNSVSRKKVKEVLISNF